MTAGSAASQRDGLAGVEKALVWANHDGSGHQ